MKYYSYSVKKLLSSHYGNNTIFKMRNPDNRDYTKMEEYELLPCLWQYADKEALNWFIGEYFLLDTIIEDDYIAYIVQFGNEKVVYLMFMHTESEPYFHLNVDYAGYIISSWEKKGYSAFILRVCIYAQSYMDRGQKKYKLGTHGSEGHGLALYELRTVNDGNLLVSQMHSCWEFYYQKLIFLSGTYDLKEYECLLESDVVITKGKDKDRRILSTGIDSVIELLHEEPLKIGYVEFENSSTYSRYPISGIRELVPSVNRRNMICEINIRECEKKPIVDQADNSFGSLLDSIPKLLCMTKMDPVEMHGYVLQMKYSNDAVRNYYLKCFDERIIPDQCEINNYIFTKEDFLSAKTDDNDNVYFKNGYKIPKHYLYYHSFRQVPIDYDDSVVCNKAGIEIKRIYRVPLKEFKSHFSVRQYRGWPDECFGPNTAFTDGYGKRNSNVALLSIDSDHYYTGVHMVCVESSWKYGFLYDNGTWLVPPIYDAAETFYTGCAKATRKINGKETTVLITRKGIEIPFPYDIDIDSFGGDLCPYNTEKWIGKRPYPGHYYYYDDLIPGKWGFINPEGTVVIEPKYVYALGFWYGGGEYSVVARLVGEDLLWGVIDKNGEEIIPCKYNELYCPEGDVVVFEQEESGLYGLMDFHGNIIVEPSFPYIAGYDPKHKLITAGDGEYDLGVYSLEQKKMIIPKEFDYVSYHDDLISCEERFSSRDRIYDYNGKELFFSDYDSIGEYHGRLTAWKNEKVGMIDFNGNVIVPLLYDYVTDIDLKLYEKGYYIKRTGKRVGLNRVDGTVAIPIIYSDLRIYGDYAIASVHSDGNKCVNDTLFSIDGTVLLEGPYHNMLIDTNGILNADTPNGKQYYAIMQHRKRTSG